MAESYPEKSWCGFAPSVLSPHDELEPLALLGDMGLVVGDSERILNNIYPENPPNIKPERHKPVRTKNRKCVSRSETITHDGVVYPIHNKQSYGVYLCMIHRFIEQLNICIKKWVRVFVIRFDLSQGFYFPHNKMISKFRKNLARRIERAYGIFEIGFVWVREHERAKKQHYHFALFLDGDLINHPAKLKEIISETWAAVKVGNKVHIPEACFYNVSNAKPAIKADVIFRLSYFAKQRGKGYRPDQTKDYSTSRLVAR